MIQPETILTRLESVVAQYPTKPFVHIVSNGLVKTLTFNKLWDDAASYGAALRDRGVVPGDIVAISIQSSTELYSIFVGCMRIGAIPTLMPFPNAKQDPGYFWMSHAQLFALTNIKALVTYRENANILKSEIPEAKFSVFVHGDLVATEVSGSAFDENPDPMRVAFLQHSSGTTGLKKGVMLSHYVVLKQVADYQESLDFDAVDIVSSWLPLYHDMGLITSFMLPMLSGATVVALDPFEWVAKPGQLLDVIQNFRATFCWMPNFAFQHLARSVRPSQAWDLSSLRSLINCSEPCRAETFDIFAERFGGFGAPSEKLQTCYAMAETVFAVTQSPCGRVCRRLRVDMEVMQRQGRIELVDHGGKELLSCGSPLPGVKIEISGADGDSLADGTIGQITLSGEYLFSGYNQRPELTDEKLKGHRYFTGDMGFLLDDELYVTGRIDDLIISYGRNFYAHEIEDCLVGINGLVPGRAVALGVPDRGTGSQLTVLVAERDESSLDPTREIKRKVLERLGLTLSRIELVDRGWLIKTSSGKISRARNLEKFLDGRQGGEG